MKVPRRFTWNQRGAARRGTRGATRRRDVGVLDALFLLLTYLAAAGFGAIIVIGLWLLNFPPFTFPLLDGAILGWAIWMELRREMKPGKKH